MRPLADPKLKESGTEMTTMRSRSMRYFRHFLDVFDRVMSWIIIVAMAILAAVVVLQVFFRYVLNDSLDWGWDIPRFCFILVVLLSIPLGIRYNAHVGVDIVFERFNEPTKRAVRRFNAIFMILLSAVAAYYGALLAFDTWDQMMPGISLSVGLFYVGLAVGQFHTVLHVLLILITGENSKETLSET